MSRCTAVLMLLLGFEAIHASEAVIAVPEVEIRSGPSGKYYATGILRKGDRVDVIGQSNGYLEILPPSGSFSLIRKDQVERKASGIDVVKTDGAETVVGSGMVNRLDVRGATLSRGSLVTIVDEIDGYYKIAPLNEVRYLSAEAIGKPGEGGVAVGPPPPPGTADPPGQWSPAKAEPLTVLEQADLAYHRKDWPTAQRLFESLAKSKDYETRVFAQNRLEFIRKQKATPESIANSPLETGPKFHPAAESPSPEPPPAKKPAQPVSLPKPASTYTYATDKGQAKIAPIQVEPAPSPGKPVSNPKPPPIDPDKFVGPPAWPAKPEPVLKEPVVPKSAVRGEFKVPGRLRKAFVTDAGKPIYFLEDSAGKMRAYLSPAEGVNLAYYLGQTVEVSGENKTYRTDLRGDHFIAVAVEPMAN